MASCASKDKRNRSSTETPDTDKLHDRKKSNRNTRANPVISSDNMTPVESDTAYANDVKCLSPNAYFEKSFEMISRTEPFIRESKTSSCHNTTPVLSDYFVWKCSRDLMHGLFPNAVMVNGAAQQTIDQYKKNVVNMLKNLPTSDDCHLTLYIMAEHSRGNQRWLPWLQLIFRSTEEGLIPPRLFACREFKKGAFIGYLLRSCSPSCAYENLFPTEHLGFGIEQARNASASIVTIRKPNAFSDANGRVYTCSHIQSGKEIFLCK
jgi:hypothetical protein